MSRQPNRAARERARRVHAQRERLAAEREALRNPLEPGPEADPRLLPAVEMLARTGAEQFKIWFCDEEIPIAWIAAARWGDIWQVAGALNPLSAIFRLCDDVMDGGTCLTCGRPTGFEPSIDPMPLSELVCWYQWDPELKTFRRGCAGDDDERGTGQESPVTGR